MIIGANKRRAATSLQEGVRRAFSQLRDMHRAPDRNKGDLVVIPLRHLAESNVDLLSVKRRRLLLKLQDHGPSGSVTELAQALGRPRSRVSQDVDVLARMNLVGRGKRGRKRRVGAGPAKIVISLD